MNGPKVAKNHDFDMATSTPQRRSLGRPRPSFGNSPIKTASTPNLAASQISPQRPPPLPTTHVSARRPSASSAVNRKTSISQLPNAGLSTIADGSEGYTPNSEGGSSPFIMYPNKPMTSRTVSDDPRNGNQDLGVGDIVDVPGGMHGTIKFIGEVKGKKGYFAGVELSKEFAARGKNDGDVDG